MVIAVPYKNGEVFGHFGHTEQFKLYSAEGGAVASAEIVDTMGSGHGALAGFLAARGVDTLLCGGIGGGAVNALSAANIRVFGGVTGNADEAVKAFLAGHLQYDPNAHCSHHHEGHDCGEHGDHTCGDHDHTCGDHGCHGHDEH